MLAYLYRAFQFGMTVAVTSILLWETGNRNFKSTFLFLGVLSSMLQWCIGVAEEILNI